MEVAGFLQIFLLFPIAVQCHAQDEINPNDDIYATSSGGEWRISESPLMRVAWNTSDSAVTIALTGPSDGYVAMAISVDQMMGPADDAYVCSRASPTSDSIGLTTALITGRAPPVKSGELVDFGIVLLESGIAEGSISCTFRRPRSVAKSDVTWNVVATNYNLLFAHGSVDSGGAVQYHGSGNRVHTAGAFNITDNSSYKRESTATELPMSTTEQLAGATTISGGDRATAIHHQYFIIGLLIFLAATCFAHP